MSDIVKLTPRDLFHLTEGQRIEWCSKHEASFFDMDRCGRYLWEEPFYDGDPDPGECVVESRFIVDAVFQGEGET